MRTIYIRKYHSFLAGNLCHTEFSLGIFYQNIAVANLIHPYGITERSNHAFGIHNCPLIFRSLHGGISIGERADLVCCQCCQLLQVLCLINMPDIALLCGFTADKDTIRAGYHVACHSAQQFAIPVYLGIRNIRTLYQNIGIHYINAAVNRTDHPASILCSTADLYAFLLRGTLQHPYCGFAAGLPFHRGINRIGNLFSCLICQCITIYSCSILLPSHNFCSIRENPFIIRCRCQGIL